MNDANIRPPLTWRRFGGQALGLAALMCLSLGGYLAVLKWRGPDAQLVTHSRWDDLIPYEPIWVWVYLIPYVIGPIAIGLIRPATFRWFVSRGLVVVGISLLIFIIVPTQTAKRPAERELSGLTAQLYEMMIAVDEPPANAAPSLHVSLTCLLALALLRDFPRWWPIIVGGVGLVWLATLFTRQHHVLDIVTGAALALIIAFAPLPFSREPSASAGRAQPSK